MSGAGMPTAAEQQAGLVVELGDERTLERLAAASASRPDLAGVAPFWLAIYRAQLAARQALMAAQPVPAWTLRGERLLDGRPQLDAGDLPLAAGPLAELVGRLELAWRGCDPTRQPSRQVDWLCRVRLVFGDPSLGFGQRRDLGLDDALAALALVPYLEWAAAAVAPALQGELEAWSRGWCPACGGYPDLALLWSDPARRSLVCSRCSTPWPYRRVGCPFCSDVDRQAYHAGEDGRYRLYVCEACRRYLKTVDARAFRERLDPRVERLITISMDLAALKAGYGPMA